MAMAMAKQLKAALPMAWKQAKRDTAMAVVVARVMLAEASMVVEVVVRGKEPQGYAVALRVEVR